MPDLTLEPAAYGDPAVVALTAQVQAYYRRIYGGEDVAPLADEQFVPPEGRFLLARLDGVPAGMGGWRRIATIDALGGQRPAEVRRMYTVPTARHRGVARALLSELERTATVDGADVMVLSTGSQQPDAIAFYRRAGYVDVPQFGHWAGWDGVVCLGRRLDPWHPDPEPSEGAHP